MESNECIMVQKYMICLHLTICNILLYSSDVHSVYKLMRKVQCCYLMYNKCLCLKPNSHNAKTNKRITIFIYIKLIPVATNVVMQCIPFFAPALLVH